MIKMTADTSADSTANRERNDLLKRAVPDSKASTKEKTK